MRYPWTLLAVLGWVAICTNVEAQSPPIKPKINLTNLLPLLDARSPDALAGVLRSVVLESMPTPLHEAAPNWGNTRMVAHAVKWRRRGIILVPEVHKTPKNDGTWRKYRITTDRPEDTLVLDIRNVTFSESMHMHFEVYLAFDGRAEYYHHVWESGVRLYSGQIRARFRAKVWLQCEASARLEPGKKYWPDAIFQLKVNKAKLDYDNLVFEHVPGLGGAAAKAIGNFFHEALQQWRPSLERNLLERGNQAITRAAGHREVRVSLSRIFEKAFR